MTTKQRIIISACILVMMLTSMRLGQLAPLLGALMLSVIALVAWVLLFGVRDLRALFTTACMTIASTTGFFSLVTDQYIQGTIVIVTCCVGCTLFYDEKKEAGPKDKYGDSAYNPHLRVPIALNAGMNQDYTKRKYEARAFTLSDVDHTIGEMQKDIDSGEAQYKKNVLSPFGSQKLNRDKLLLAALKEWRTNN